MEEHTLLDIVIHFRTLILTFEKIKKLDNNVNLSFTDNLLSTRQAYIDKLLFLLESSNNNFDNHNNIDNDNDNDNKEEHDLSQKLNSMSSLFGGEQVVESGNINPAVFDNFGSGLARLLGGNTIQTTINRPSLYKETNIIHKQNENFSFSLKKKIKDEN